MRLCFTAGAKPLVTGNSLLTMGFNPGPQFKPILAEAFAAQLAGIFDSEEGGRDFVLARHAPDAPN